MKNPKIAIEHWITFIAVVEEGSFARAAELLKKSQSAISYSIAKLEEQLPTPALQHEGRKAVLTSAGEVLYHRAKQLLNQANDIEQLAGYLADGWERTITLAVDAIVPIEPVLRAMRNFSETAPHTRIMLLETTLSGTDEALLERRADLVISPNTPAGFLGTPITEVDIVAVAHPNHILARSDRELGAEDLKHARQIVVRDSGTRRNQDGGWLDAQQRITVSHFSTVIKALEFGLGFSFVPIDLVREQLEAGKLKRLNLTLEAWNRMPIYLILSMNDNLGPAMRSFVEQLKRCFSEQNKIIYTDKTSRI